MPPKLKSDDNVYDREERLNTLHVKTLYTCIYGAICVFSYYAKYICFTFSLHYSSVSDNVVALEVCRYSRIHSFLQNFFFVSATSRAITKADLPENFTIFHSRMSTTQPTWPVCTTSECWHTCCGHFCSCSSHKTIPSLRELVVTQR